MKVSVIVPAFNAGAFIGDAIASLRAQTVGEWEAIVVDDGSTDDTLTVARELAARDQRIRVLQQPNAGEAAARNTGIAASTAEWLLFLDADDWIAPTYFERMLAALEADPSLDAVHCAWARVAADGTLVTEGYEPPTGDMFEIWARRSAFPVHACVVRRTLVASVGGFDTSFSKSTDWDLWQRAARTGARFGAIREVLAFYRMSPGSASLDAASMLEHGLRVLRQGHAPDPRVPQAAERHATGMPAQDVPSQAFYLLSWCAGLMLGRGEDPRVLLDQLADVTFPELYPEAVAQCLFDAAPLASREPPVAWERLWPTLLQPSRSFLEALEQHSGATGLADRAHVALAKEAFNHAPSWQMVAGTLRETEVHAADGRRDLDRVERERDADRERHRDDLAAAVRESERHAAQVALVVEQLAAAEHAASERQREVDALRDQVQLLTDSVSERDRTVDGLVGEVGGVRGELVALRADLEIRLGAADTAKASLVAQLKRAEHEVLILEASPERRAGSFLLHRLRLAAVARALSGMTAVVRQHVSMTRLVVDRMRSRAGRPRVLATVCTDFPIYSQTFVHQELEYLAQHSGQVRIAYSVPAPREAFGGRFGQLWDARRRLSQHRPIQRRHFLHYMSSRPAAVDTLLSRLSGASGIAVERLREHDNVLEGFTFARMAERYRAQWIQSYFFYDRSLMALIAGELLDIPRGVTCYADHLLDDYELKVVPLHLETAELIVATSDRIRQELLEISPDANPDRILVKPNGIDTAHFPLLSRGEPATGQPYRVVTVCRIEPKKGLLTLVEAVADLRRRGVAVEAHIVGVADEWSAASRDYKTALDERIGTLDLWGSVHLEGRHDHAGIMRFLELAQLFVAPFVATASGDKDGIPTALLEGMATGLPVVASRAGSIEEVVIDGEHGLLVPPADANALADAIAEMLGDRSRREQFGRSAAARVRARFDVATCESEFHSRIHALVRESHR